MRLEFEREQAVQELCAHSHGYMVPVALAYPGAKSVAKWEGWAEG